MKVTADLVRRVSNAFKQGPTDTTEIEKELRATTASVVNVEQLEGRLVKNAEKEIDQWISDIFFDGLVSNEIFVKHEVSIEFLQSLIRRGFHVDRHRGAISVRIPD